MKIQTTIILLMACLLVVTGVLGGGILIYLQKRALESTFEDSASTLANTVLVSLEPEMVQGDPAHVQDEVVRIGKARGLEDVEILDPQGRVVASADRSRIGMISDAPGLKEVVTTTQPLAPQESTDGLVMLRLLLPMTNKPACQDCHDPSEKVLGAVAVGIDATRLKTQIRSQGLLLGGFILVGIVLLTLVLSFTLRRTVSRRLFRLGEATGGVARGDYSVRAEEEGKDEISNLARSFNEMAESLERRSAELAELRRSLEDRVRRRTVQLEENEKIRRELLRRLTSAQEEERARVARELHDEIGQGLTSIAVTCASAAKRLPAQREKERELLTNVRAMAIDGLNNVRRIIAQLRPEALHDLGLPAALRWMVQERLWETGIEFELDVPDHFNRLSEPVELALYRVAQESLNNVIRHSEATKVKVSLRLNEDSVCLQVADNGKGFDSETVFENQLGKESWGLVGMRERLLPLEGTLRIQASIGKGTTLSALVPLTERRSE